MVRIQFAITVMVTCPFCTSTSRICNSDRDILSHFTSALDSLPFGLVPQHFICSFCSSSFTSIHTLVSHYTHCSSPNTPLPLISFRCLICGHTSQSTNHPTCTKISPEIPHRSFPDISDQNPLPLDLSETQLEGMLNDYNAALSVLPSTCHPLSPSSTQAAGCQLLGSTVSSPCILSTGLTKEQHVELEKVLTLLGGKLKSRWSRSVTHVVSTLDSNRRAKRTIKYLQGVVSNCYVVGFDWVEKSLIANQWVDELPFLSSGDATVNGGPLIAVRNSRSRTPGIFSGWTFTLKPPFFGIDSNGVEGLILASGGKVVKERADGKFLFLVGQKDKVIDCDHVMIDWFLRCCSANQVLDTDNFSRF
ncbi:hypothetical protein P9112_000953 [Eukaryota sp. TZLM1-RC]